MLISVPENVFSYYKSKVFLTVSINSKYFNWNDYVICRNSRKKLLEVYGNTRKVPQFPKTRCINVASGLEGDRSELSVLHTEFSACPNFTKNRVTFGQGCDASVLIFFLFLISEPLQTYKASLLLATGYIFINNDFLNSVLLSAISRTQL